MVELEVQGMTCGGCASRVSRVAKSVDAAARVEVDLRSKRVRIDSAADAARFARALNQAGYPAVARQ